MELPHAIRIRITTVTEQYEPWRDPKGCAVLDITKRFPLGARADDSQEQADAKMAQAIKWSAMEVMELVERFEDSHRSH